MNGFNKKVNVSNKEYDYIKNIFSDNNVNNVITNREPSHKVYRIDKNTHAKVIYVFTCRNGATPAIKVGMTDLESSDFADDSVFIVGNGNIDYDKLYASRDENGFITGGAGSTAKIPNEASLKIKGIPVNRIRSITAAETAFVCRGKQESGSIFSNLDMAFSTILIFKNVDNDDMYTLSDHYIHRIMHDYYGFEKMKKTGDTDLNDMFGIGFKYGDTQKQAIECIKSIISDISNGKEHVYGGSLIHPRIRQVEAVCKLSKAMGWRMKSNDNNANIYDGKNGNPPLRNLLLAANMRFGKTITAYAIIRMLGFSHVLIVSNRTNTEMNWQSDAKACGYGKSYHTIDGDDDSESLNHRYDASKDAGNVDIEFISAEKIKGNKNGTNYDYVMDRQWDLLIIDEAHEGIETNLVNKAINTLMASANNADNVLNVLKITGTPFTEGTSATDAKFDVSRSDDLKYIVSYINKKNDAYIYTINDEYADRACRKEHKDDNDNIDAQRLSYLDTAPEIEFLQYDNVDNDDMNSLFKLPPKDKKAKEDDREFINGKAVKKFIKRLMSSDDEYKKFAILSGDSDSHFNGLMKHTLWLMPSVRSCQLVKQIIESDSNLCNAFEVVDISGDKISSDEALARVHAAVSGHKKTITLTLSRLIVGTTVPEWDGVLMLCNTDSAIKYMQAAYRCMSECEGKKRVLVVDFDKDRLFRTLYSTAAETDRTDSNEDNDSKSKSDKVKDNLSHMIITKFENGDYTDGTDYIRKVINEIIDYHNSGDAENMFNKGGDASSISSLFNMNSIKKIAGIANIIDNLPNVKSSASSSENNADNDNKTARMNNESDTAEDESEPFDIAGDADDAKADTGSDGKNSNEQSYTRLLFLSRNLPNALFLTIFLRRLLEYSHDNGIIDNNVYNTKIKEYEDWSLCDDEISTLDRKNIISGIPNQIMKYMLEMVGIDYNNNNKSIIENIMNAAKDSLISYLRRELQSIYDDIIINAESFNNIDNYMLAVMRRSDRFKSLTKSIICTPSRTVNMHLTSTIGGYDWKKSLDDYNAYIVDNDTAVSSPVKVDGYIRNCNDWIDYRFLDVSSKEGLYCLMIAYDKYMIKKICNPMINPRLAWLNAVNNVSIQSVNDMLGMLGVAYLWLPLLFPSSDCTVDNGYIVNSVNGIVDNATGNMERRWFLMNENDAKDIYNAIDPLDDVDSDYIVNNLMYSSYGRVLDNIQWYIDRISIMKEISDLNGRIRRKKDNGEYANKFIYQYALNDSEINAIRMYMRMKDIDLDSVEDDIIKNMNAIIANNRKKDVSNAKKAYDSIRDTLNIIRLELVDDNAGNDGKNHGKMFDVAVGNPPYNVGESSKEFTAIYPYFVLSSLKSSNICSFIHPIKWVTGKKGTRILLEYMNTCDSVVSFFSSKSDVLFSGIDTNGDICFYIIDSNYHGDVHICNMDDCSDYIANRIVNNGVLNLTDSSVSIMNKVITKCKSSFSSIIMSQTPFGLKTNDINKIYKLLIDDKSSKITKILAREGKPPFGRKPKWIEVHGKSLPYGNEQISAGWRIYQPRAADKFANGKKSFVLGDLHIGGSGEACADYLSTTNFDTQEEAYNCIKYLKTKIIRYIILQRKRSTNISKNLFTDVPLIDFTASNVDIDWNQDIDEINTQLEDWFGLTDVERAEVDADIADM